VSKAFHRLLGKDFTSRRERLEPVANLDCKPRHIRRTDFHHVPFLILAEALLARVNVGREDEMEQPVSDTLAERQVAPEAVERLCAKKPPGCEMSIKPVARGFTAYLQLRAARDRFREIAKRRVARVTLK
jgi:hypothetical protein